MTDELFTEKLRTAIAIVMKSRRRDGHLVEEVTQEALRTIHQYFLCKGMGDYTDRDEAEFGGWLFALCRRHVSWALSRLQRKRELPLGNPNRLNELPSSSGCVSERVYEQALRLVIETIRSLPEPLQGVLLDDLNGLGCKESAEARGISRNYVAILRSKGRELLLRVLQEQIVCVC